jgi:predicted GNAT family acetyltransferase
LPSFAKYWSPYVLTSSLMPIAARLLLMIWACVIVAHAEIDPQREGEGLGSELVRGTLDRMRASGRTVIPTCPFTADYIRRHPEYTDLVDPGVRSRFAPVT